jgi:hypothetical protein
MIKIENDKVTILELHVIQNWDSTQSKGGPYLQNIIWATKIWEMKNASG